MDAVFYPSNYGKLGSANTWTADNTFNVIKTQHCDAATSAGVHIGNTTHQDVAIFGAGGSQGTTFYGQVNGTALVLSGAASCTTLTASSATTAANGSITIASIDAGLRWRISSGGTTADKNQYEWRPVNAGAGYEYFQLRKINDANTVFTDLLKVQNTGQLDVTAGITCTTLTTSGNATVGGSYLTLGGRDAMYQTAAYSSFYGGSVSTLFTSSTGADAWLRLTPGAPATPGGLEVNIGGGQIKAGSGITCTTLTAQSASGLITVARTTAANSSYFNFTDTTATKYNWIAGVQYNVDNGFEITASSAVGGSTYNQVLASFKYDGTKKLAFYGVTPVAQSVLAAATGTATRTTYDTTTVTTQQLAERVKAIIDDLRAYGLEG